MALTASMIRKKIAASSWMTRDNTAQAIVKGATITELASLDDEGLLLLFNAMDAQWNSKRDNAGIKSLATYCKYRPITTPLATSVSIIKKATPSNIAVTTYLTTALVTRIYAAENKRLSWGETVVYDGDTLGRGQLGQPAYTDVSSLKYYKTVWESYAKRFVMAQTLAQKTSFSSNFINNTPKVVVPSKYSVIYKYQPLEDFVVTGYLAVLMRRTTKSKRSAKDTARFAVALYHGMRKKVVAAQMATKNEIDWAPVEAELLAKGHKDDVSYVNEVVK